MKIFRLVSPQKPKISLFHEPLKTEIFSVLRTNQEKEKRKKEKETENKEKRKRKQRRRGHPKYIFNRSFKEGIFPDNLKVARICPIYKGKGSKSDPDNYRSISVLSVVARLFEKLVHNQLLKHLDKYLYSNQSGFRPRHSTETSLLNATNQLFLNIDRGQYNVAVFIDLRKAFDTVNHNILLCKLWHYGIRGTELRWFKSYLSHRHQYCSVSGHASEFTGAIHLERQTCQ